MLGHCKVDEIIFLLIKKSSLATRIRDQVIAKFDVINWWSKMTQNDDHIVIFWISDTLSCYYFDFVKSFFKGESDFLSKI